MQQCLDVIQAMCETMRARFVFGLASDLTARTKLIYTGYFVTIFFPTTWCHARQARRAEDMTRPAILYLLRPNYKEDSVKLCLVEVQNKLMKSVCQVQRKQHGRMKLFIFFPPSSYFLKHVIFLKFCMREKRQNVLNNSKAVQARLLHFWRKHEQCCSCKTCITLYGIAI